VLLVEHVQRGYFLNTPIQAGSRLSLVSFATLLLIALMMGSNHVAARFAFQNGGDVATAAVSSSSPFPFFDDSGKEQQEVFQKTAKIVAKLERKWSLEDAQKYEDEAVSKGITIKEITVEESQKLKDASPDQYTTAYTIIEGSKELVDKIKNKG
jgi:hypothetical protein